MERRKEKLKAEMGSAVVVSKYPITRAFHTSFQCCLYSRKARVIDALQLQRQERSFIVPVIHPGFPRWTGRRGCLDGDAISTNTRE